MSRALAHEPRADGRLRLFCFHHAAGGATSFARWRDAFGPGVDVLPVRLPGRETRLREPRITSREQLLEELDELLVPLLDRPYALYGHSLGGLVAHALALHAADRRARPPEALLIGASPAPHQDTQLAAAARRGDDELLRVLRANGGVTAELLAHPAWLRLMLDAVRDDLLLAGALRAAAGKPDGETLVLPVDLWAFAGSRDHLATPERLGAWARYTSAGFRLLTVAGGHFFHRDREFVELLAPVVRGCASVPRASERVASHMR